MKIGVIGAGAAGLAAAYELLKKGHSVKVYEAAPFVGGQASTFDVGNGRLERGYHHLFKSDTHMVDLIHELGLERSWPGSSPRSAFITKGRSTTSSPPSICSSSSH